MKNVNLSLKPLYINFMQELLKHGDIFTKPSNEPWTTIIHNDLWANNTMQVFNNGKIVYNKIQNFQLYQYVNPFLDLVFFISSSVRKNIVRKYFDDLVLHYQDNLLIALENLKCDTSAFLQNISETIADVAHIELLICYSRPHQFS